MKVKKLLKVGGITVACLLGLFVVVAVALAILLNQPSVQNKVLHYAVGYLSDKLQTRVQVDSVAVEVLNQRVSLYGLDVDDRESRPMLAVDTLSVDLDFWKLLSKRVEVAEIAIYGLNAHLLKPSPDEPANYQFVIDAFRKEPSDDTSADTNEQKVAFDVEDLTLRRIHVTYNDVDCSLSQLTVHKSHKGYSANLNSLQTAYTSTTKKGPRLNRVGLGQLTLKPGHPMQLSIAGLHYFTDNGLPRKNELKPKRGYFDTGHMDVTAQMDWEVFQVGRDSIRATLTHATATDSVTGIDLRDLRFALLYHQKQFHFTDIFLQQRTTTLRLDSAWVQLSDSAAGNVLQYSTSPITGHVVLQDISRLFSPALGHFVLPLQLTTEMSGQGNGMTFRNVRVSTPDQRLNIHANGHIDHLDKGRELVVGFHVDRMTAKGRVAQDVINQFKVKKLMMKQLDALGTIGYTGDFSVVWRKQQFSGTLTSQQGSLRFNLALDANTHYLTGSARTVGFRLAQLFNTQAIGPISFDTNFKIDISKERTAQMRRRVDGKLPIGEVAGIVNECSYKRFNLRNLNFSIVSDGSEAVGTVDQQRRYLDLSLNFVLTSTDSIRKMKVRPHLQLHKSTDAEKQARAERKQQRRDEKEQRRQERAEQKEQRRQERAERKAARKAEKQGDKE